MPATRTWKCCSALRRFGNKLRVYRAALSTFRPECDALLAGIAVNGRLGAQPELHTLKGLAIMQGGQALSQLAAALEKRARAGEAIGDEALARITGWQRGAVVRQPAGG